MTTAQLNFFEQSRQEPASSSRAKPNIDTHAIQAELTELLGGKVKVKLDKTIDATVSIYTSDNLVTVKLNPRRIRTQAQLDQRVNDLRADIGNGRL